MAPHTSAATVGRVVGFTSAAVGYAHPYFHAAKRRNCFHPETKLWYEDGERRNHYERIDDFVERYLDPETAETDDFGTHVQELSGDVSVPSVDDDGNVVRQPVEAVSKHPAPDHMVSIETRSGRKLTVTPDHEIHVFDGEGITSKRASELTESDQLIKPANVDSLSPADAAQQFDLLAEFMRTDIVDNRALMVKGLDKEFLYSLFRDTLESEWDGQFYPLQSTTEYLGLSKKGLSNYLYRESIPASVLVDVLETSEAVVERIPDDVTLGMKRDTTEIDRYVELNESVAILLGYYAAEGFARKQETPKGTIHQTTFSGVEEEARAFFVDTLTSEFGVEPYRENDYKVTVSGRLVRVLFDTVLDCGVHADEKRVPACIFDASDEVVSAFLGGYISGDGTVDKNVLEITATTVSHELKKDLLALFTRLGITARVEQIEPVPLSKKFPGHYDEEDESMSAVSYVLRITSVDAVRFDDVIDIHLQRKQQRLERHIQQKTVYSRRVFDGGNGEYLVDSVADIEYVESDTEYTYCLTVSGTRSLVANDMSQKQCDGDEDCVMLLMDGLLNFSKSYLPDQRGGSVAEDSRLVAVDPEDNVRFLTFEEFWKQLESPLEVDGKYRKRTCAAEGWRTYAFDGNHEASLQPIEKAIRYRADDDEKLLRVETQFGRSIEITADHSLFRYDEGIEEVAGDDLEEGDLVLAPQSLDIEGAETTIDAADCVGDPYVVIDDHLEDLLRTVWETTERGSDAHAAFNSGLAYRLSKCKISLDRFEKILAEAGYVVPSDVTIALEGSTDGIDRTIEVDEEFAWLLGLFVAEGTTSSICPAIHNADEELIDRATEIATGTLGHEPEQRWSNRAYELRFPAVFREVLYSLGFEERETYTSSEKVVPECILTAPEPVVKSFLRGFIAGDGSETSDDNHTTVAFHSTSEDVRDGIVYLLHRLGLVANISARRDRDGNRQDIYTVTVSGGATDNPLRNILDGQELYQPKSLVVGVPEGLLEIREMNVEEVKQLIPKYLKRRDNISLEKLEELLTELDNRELPEAAQAKVDSMRPLVDGDLSYVRVQDIERVDYDGYLYDLQVGGEPIFLSNWLYAHNSMDAPLVMSSRIDPSEIDDEAHNIDIMDRYPREFYEATRELTDPAEVEDIMTIAESTLGTDREYTDFRHTHDVTDIAAGPDLSAYKTLGSMEEKMDAQLHLSRKLRAVVESDVAERIIEYHFLPDLIGNLRAFSRQEVRCLDCGEKYRRMPLTGDCRECGGRVNLTVHQGSVNKYIDTAIRVADEFGARDYTKQRLRILETKIESVFENDHNKQSGIADFM
jgi:DNA polymerase II large subunit